MEMLIARLNATNSYLMMKLSLDGGPGVRLKK